VQREYKNAVTEESLQSNIHDEFVESLTHDSFIVQIPKLSEEPKERLERAFALFNQKLTRADDRHRLYFPDESSLKDDELIQKMARILKNAVAEAEISEQMEHEDVLQEDIERSMRKLKRQISDLENEKEQERKLKEQERKLKEEALSKEQEALVKEKEALSKIKQAYQALIDSGMSSEQAKGILNLDD
jgi:thymidylate synthase ThyX